MHAALKLLDDAGIEGELAVREVRTGRVETSRSRCGAGRSRCARSSGSCARSSDGASPFVPDLLFGSNVLGVAAGRRP